MSKILNQRESEVTRYLPRPPITSIIHRPANPSEWINIADPVCLSSCIACTNPRCMKYDESELTATDKRLDAFPIDLTSNVCVTGAIQWKKGDPHPTVLESNCINCGICAARCPVGAIAIHSGSARVYFDTNNLVKATTAEQSDVLSKFSRVYHAGYMHAPSPENIEAVYKKIESLHTDARFPNIITRNLLLALGEKAMIRRRGDVYLRIDSLAEFNDRIAIFEIEFHSDSLESPRAILDDIAVLSSRYGIPKEQIRPFIVSYEFPNIRTEYWRVIKDIQKVLNVSIESISLGALLIMVWLYLGSIQPHCFYADVDNASITKTMEIAMDASLEKIKYTRAILNPIK